jgi:four helix bundle protein
LEKAKELQQRAKRYAIRIIRLFRALPRTEEARIVGRQLVRAGTSIGANYRAVCRARTRAGFTAKLGVVAEEADEMVFWLEIVVEAEILPLRKVEDLLAEANCAPDERLALEFSIAQSLSDSMAQ